jgi:GT2 family glycosyltransferase
MKTFVIIPVHNRADFTLVCLKSLSGFLENVDSKVLLIDNGSLHITADLLQGWAQDNNASVIRLDENRGFAGAVNAGVEFIGPEISKSFVCIMHNDCMGFAGGLGKMANCLAQMDDDVGSICPRTDYANEWNPVVPQFREAFQKIKPSNKERVLLDDIESLVKTLYPDPALIAAEMARMYTADITTVNEFSSFCVLIRGGMFVKYGKWNEQFWPRGYEDRFWWRGPKKDGYINLVCNRVFVHHHGNATCDGPSMDWPQLRQKNEALFLKKCQEEGLKSIPTERRVIIPEISTLPSSRKDGTLVFGSIHLKNRSFSNLEEWMTQIQRTGCTNSLMVNSFVEAFPEDKRMEIDRVLSQAIGIEMIKPRMIVSFEQDYGHYVGYLLSLACGLQTAVKNGYRHVAFIEGDMILKTDLLSVIKEMEENQARIMAPYCSLYNFLEIGLMFFDVEHVAKNNLVQKLLSLVEDQQVLLESREILCEHLLEKLFGKDLFIVKWPGGRDDARSIDIEKAVYLTHATDARRKEFLALAGDVNVHLS